jgi:hypothetical protein
MDYEDRCVVIDDEDDLKQPSIVGWTPNQVLFVGLAERERRASARDDFLSFTRLNSMQLDVLDVPGVPPELHRDNYISNKL